MSNVLELETFKREILSSQYQSHASARAYLNKKGHSAVSDEIFFMGLELNFEEDAGLTILTDLFELSKLDQYTPEKFKTYLEDHDFEGIPAIDQFPVLQERHKKFFTIAYPFTGWNVEKPDGFGHYDQVTYRLDWVKKVIERTVGSTS